MVPKTSSSACVTCKLSCMVTIAQGNIVISTPEKWDMLSRRWRQRRFVKETALFIVDELHLLGQVSHPLITSGHLQIPGLLCFDWCWMLPSECL